MSSISGPLLLGLFFSLVHVTMAHLDPLFNLTLFFLGFLNFFFQLVAWDGKIETVNFVHLQEIYGMDQLFTPLRKTPFESEPSKKAV